MGQGTAGRALEGPDAGRASDGSLHQVMPSYIATEGAAWHLGEKGLKEENLQTAWPQIKDAG